MNETWLTITGWVGSVHVRDLPAGGSVLTLRVASTPRRFKDGEWANAATAWHTVKVWRYLAANVRVSVHKGDPVLVHGRLVAEEWVRGDGSTSTENVLVAAALGHDLSMGQATFQRAAGNADPGGERGVEDPPPGQEDVSSGVSAA